MSGNNFFSEPSSDDVLFLNTTVLTCGKCKSTEDTKPCFSTDCDKVRCATCVRALCQKNSKDQLSDENGELIHVCTKASKTIHPQNNDIKYLTFHRNVEVL